MKLDSMAICEIMPYICRTKLGEFDRIYETVVRVADNTCSGAGSGILDFWRFT